MTPTDEFGIEYDDDVANVLNDPKFSVTAKLLDYRDKRKAAEAAKATQEENEKKKKESSGIFGLGVFK
jgi:hypothetical protein